MVINRREIWWADLADPRGSAPGFRRPVLILQADAFNRSRLPTVIVVALTSNLRLLDAPGNVLVPRKESGLPKDSVANATQLVTLDIDQLTECSGRLPSARMEQVETGVRLVLGL